MMTDRIASVVFHSAPVLAIVLRAPWPCSAWLLIRHPACVGIRVWCIWWTLPVLEYDCLLHTRRCRSCAGRLSWRQGFWQAPAAYWKAAALTYVLQPPWRVLLNLRALDQVLCRWRSS